MLKKPLKSFTLLDIKPQDRVLEIGSGDNPHPRSDILCDRYVHNNSQRAGEFPIVIDRPFIVADGYHLPFKTKSFDYVICSHILEHLEDPKSFLKEVVRVGESGYIEVPSALSERLFGWDFHLWYCAVERGVLVLRKKTHGVRWGNFFHKLIQREIWFRRFFEENENRFYVRYKWRKNIPIRIDKNSASLDFQTSLDHELETIFQSLSWDHLRDIMFYSNWMVGRVQRKAKKETRKLVWRLKRRFQKDQIIHSLQSILACPRCNGNVSVSSDDSILCGRCGGVYPLDGTIPVFLLKKEREKEY